MLFLTSAYLNGIGWMQIKKTCFRFSLVNDCHDSDSVVTDYKQTRGLTYRRSWNKSINITQNKIYLRDIHIEYNNAKQSDMNGLWLNNWRVNEVDGYRDDAVAIDIDESECEIWVVVQKKARVVQRGD